MTGAAKATNPDKKMPMRVRHVREALKREFDGRIDLSDVAHKKEDEREQTFLSRALAALMVRHLTGCTTEAAAASVVDGRHDNGIDAVAIADGAPHLWLVQTKWSNTGRARVETSDVRSMADGLTLLDEGCFDRFNERFQQVAERVKAVWRDPRVKTTLVIAAMRGEPLSIEVQQILEDSERRFNSLGPVLDHRVYDAAAIWQIVRDDIEPPSIDLSARMEHWTRITEPYEAYYGPVSVDEVAEWYKEHGDRLFKQNIRMPLGLTQVNASMVRTLLDDPASFYYFNNGITVLCDRIEPHYWSRSGRGPVELRLYGASVVNGAQTVVATYEATRQDADRAAEAMVGMRVISLAGCPENFAVQITEATNTQNRVEPRDFVALDPVQADISVDLALTLGKTYVVRRGELDPPPEAGCSVVEAATALACAHRNPELAARAKNPDLLWERGSQGTYDLLFGEAPTAHQLWRSVLLVRSVRAALYEWRRRRQGRAATIAEEGDLLIAHIIFRHMGLEGIDDPETSWEDDVLPQVSDLAIDVLSRVVYHVDAAFGPNSFIGSTFANPERCRELAGRILADLRRGVPASALPEAYQPDTLKKRSRRPNTVAVLVDSRRIADNTRLVFQPGTGPEREALASWLAEDARRGEATWVNERTKPLLWAADGERYSPTGLVQHMWDLAGWESAPVAVQGPRRWFVPGEGSLVELAEAVRREQESDET